MSKIMVSLLERTTETGDKKLPKQAQEILTWFDSEYGKGTPVDQKAVMEALDSHQEDNKVLSATPRQPISRIWNFYRKRLADDGYINVDKLAEKEAEVSADSDNTEKKVSKRRRKDAPVEETAGASEGVL